MKTFGIWILLSFAIYYVISLLTGSKNATAALILGMILALGIVLVI